MSKRVLIGLLAVSVLVMWGSAANAFNRINGIIIRHGSFIAEVTLCTNPLQDTTLSIFVDLTIDCGEDEDKIVLELDDMTIIVDSTDFTGASNPPICDNETALITFQWNGDFEAQLEDACSNGGEYKWEYEHDYENEDENGTPEVKSVDIEVKWKCLQSGGLQCPTDNTLIEKDTTTCEPPAPGDPEGEQCDVPEHGPDTEPLPFPSSDSCKKGGWKDLVDSQGNSFKNQGDCVSFVATGGRNLGSGGAP